MTILSKLGQQTEIDWQLLAAIGYQESHWNPKAKSPTGCAWHYDADADNHEASWELKKAA